MLEGLEISEIFSSKVFQITATKRFDPEYFQKSHLRDELIIKNRLEDFISFADLGLTVDASAFYPSIEVYYGSGDLPFLRVADIDSIIDFKNSTRIPKELCDIFPTLSKVNSGDVVFTKGGSVARIGLVTQEAAVSRDLIFLNSSKLTRENQIFLYLYAQTVFFNQALLRSSSQTAQPHLTITLVRELKLLRATGVFKSTLLSVVDQSFSALKRAHDLQAQAETTLLQALNLSNWQAPEPQSYTRSSSDAFAAGRLDAEHFQPKFQSLTTHLRTTGQAKNLGSVLLVNQRGKQPDYTDSDSGVPVVNSKHINKGEVRIDSGNRFAHVDEKTILIQPGDVVMNGTGVGTIGRAAPYLHKFSAVPDNHVTILKPKPGMDAVYLSVFINSVAGQMQVSQRLRGSSGQIELYPNDIGRFVVWDAPGDLQTNIRQLVIQSFEAKQRATQLLDAAKRAVEIAIESSEDAALAYLAQHNPN